MASKKSHAEVKFRRESSVPNSHNPDILWNGNNWEIKRIESPNSRKVYERAKEAAVQSRYVIIDLSLRTVSIDDAVEKLLAAISDGIIEDAFIVTDEQLKPI